jgi:uncharacterized protein
MSNLYYKIRPVIPRWFQIMIRRRYALAMRPYYRSIWPIDKGAGKSPAGWNGWPDSKKFALILTHDVESEKGLERIKPLIEIEKKFGFRSSFNFVAGDYKVPDSIFKSLRKSGFEIGVHGLHHRGNLFSSFEDFKRQAAVINQKIKKWDAVGFRSPSMYHNLDWIHHLHIEYDSSTFDTDPFEPQSDGAGTIFPFWVDNADGGGYIELPYTLPQDFTVFILLGEKNIDTWKRKLDWIAAQGGMALMSSHPDYLNFGTGKLAPDEYPAKYYQDFLAYISKNYQDQYWHVTPREAARFWREKQPRLQESPLEGHKAWIGQVRTDAPMLGETGMRASQTAAKKKIWIDLDNSPHVPFFKPIINSLNEGDNETIITARDCFQVCGLADLMGVEYKKVGRHYGKNKLMKVVGLLIRSLQLIPTVLKTKPDLSVSHGSRSQVMTSWLFNIPTVVIADYEYTQTVIKPSYVIVPEMIPDASVKGYKKSFLKYKGIKEDVYVPDFKPDPSILENLGIRNDELLVTIRPPATEAHYHNPESELLFEETINFLGKQKDLRMVILPRNEKKQTAWVRSQWADWCSSGKIIIPEHVVDGLNLIWYSDFVISGGGTMNREAAALGVPVYSIFRGTIGAVDHYLEKQGRLVLLTSVEDIHSKIKVEKRSKTDTLKVVNRTVLNTMVKLLEKILGDKILPAERRKKAVG